MGILNQNIGHQKRKKIEAADFEDEFLPNHLLWSGNLRPLEAAIFVSVICD